MAESSLTLLHEGRHIFVVCPKCSLVHRLSDLQLRRRARYDPDWLDRIQRQQDSVARRLEDLESRARELRARAKEKAEQEELPKRIRDLLPWVERHALDPRDVRVLVNPTEFVVFEGMNSSDGVHSITFLATRSPQNAIENLDRVVKTRSLRWNTLRVSDDGVVQPSAGAPLENFEASTDGA